MKREFLQIADVLNQPNPHLVELEVLHVIPRIPAVGTLAYADGTDWNPGSGEGLYVYKSGGWTFVV